jgi:hypothetical protein
MTHKKKEKSEEISCFEVHDVLFWGAGGFSFSLRTFVEAYELKIYHLLI